jgi:hypothetical protein
VPVCTEQIHAPRPLAADPAGVDVVHVVQRDIAQRPLLAFTPRARVSRDAPTATVQRLRRISACFYSGPHKPGLPRNRVCPARQQAGAPSSRSHGGCCHPRTALTERPILLAPHTPAGSADPCQRHSNEQRRLPCTHTSVAVPPMNSNTGRDARAHRCPASSEPIAATPIHAQPTPPIQSTRSTHHHPPPSPPAAALRGRRNVQAGLSPPRGEAATQALRADVQSTGGAPRTTLISILVCEKNQPVSRCGPWSVRSALIGEFYLLHLENPTQHEM